MTCVSARSFFFQKMGCFLPGVSWNIREQLHVEKEEKNITHKAMRRVGGDFPSLYTPTPPPKKNIDRNFGSGLTAAT